jgi:hypothetical protein
MDVLHTMYFQVHGIYTTSSWERKNTGCAVYIRCMLSMGKYGNSWSRITHCLRYVKDFVKYKKWNQDIGLKNSPLLDSTHLIQVNHWTADQHATSTETHCAWIEIVLTYSKSKHALLSYCNNIWKETSVYTVHMFSYKISSGNLQNERERESAHKIVYNVIMMDFKRNIYMLFLVHS